MLALPETTETVSALVRRETVSFWGQDHDIQPVLVPEVFGDGAQIIGLSPLNTRPNYYVVRVDSTWSTNNHDWDKPVLIDHLEEIYECIEENFGKAYYECECSRRCNHYCESGCKCRCKIDGQRCQAHEHEDFPALNDEVGSEWFYIAGRYAHGRYRQQDRGKDAMLFAKPTW